MSTTLIPVITQAGLQAVFNATNSGLQADITHIALGDRGWLPDNTATALKNERRRIPVSNGERITPTQIHITAIEDGVELEYWVREVGFYLSDGTLLAIWSHDTQALAYKAGGVDLLLAFDMALAALPADSVNVVGTGGVNLPPATTEKLGVMRFATTAEVIAATVDNEAVTPLGVQRHGDARYSNLNHNHSGVYAPISHNHDRDYMRIANFRVTSGLVRVLNRFSSSRWAGYNDWSRNYVLIAPPVGFTLSHLQGFIQGFIASNALVQFRGDVNGDDSLYTRWRIERNINRIRVISSNTENRSNALVNYLAIWRR
jgi:hypothetical protein